MDEKPKRKRSPNFQTEEERRLAAIRRTQEYNARHPDRVAEYRNRPETKAKMAKRAKRWKQENRDKVKESAARSYFKYRDKNLERRKEYTRKFPDKVREMNRSWHDRNPGKKTEITREWIKNNPEKVLAWRRSYRNKNRERIREHARNSISVRLAKGRRRSRERAAIDASANQGIIKTIYQQAIRLQKCLGIAFHVDHVVALKNGGKHHQNNLRAIPGVFNAIKSARIDYVHPY